MNTEKQIEFDKIKQLWMDLTLTDGAKEKIQEITICLSEGALKKQLKDTTDGRFMIEKLGTPPLQNVAEVKDILMIAEKGDCLTPYQLERVETVLTAIRRLKEYLERGKMYHNSLGFYEENLNAAEELHSEIYQQKWRCR